MTGGDSGFVFKDDMSRKSKITLVAVFLGLAAIFFLLTIFVDCLTSSLEKKCTGTVYGVVTDVKTEHYNDSYYLNGREKNRTKDRNIYTITVENDDIFKYPTLSSSDTSLSVGSRVTIHYDPNDTALFYFNETEDSINALGITFTILGCICLIVGLVLLFSFFILRKYRESQLY